MFENIPVPPSFSLVRKGKTYLLLREDYKKILLEQGLDEIESYVAKHHTTSRIFHGRHPHPSILIGDDERAVLRHYIHGGLLRFLTRDLYLFGSRSFQELILTEAVRSYGIATVKPIAAMHRCIPPFFYRSYLLTLEIPLSIDFIQWFREMGSHLDAKRVKEKRMLIRKAGVLLRNFHDAGFLHGDLQLKNLLISEDQVFLIDFDRSCRKPNLSAKKRIQNLLRLNRSVDKWRPSGLPINLTDRWRFFAAYAGKDRELRVALRRALRFYGFTSFLHRVGWTLKGSKSSRVPGAEGK
jgi:serine/threonine protein kinase